MKAILAILLLSLTSCAMPDAVRGPDDHGVSLMVLRGKGYTRRTPGWWSEGGLSMPVGKAHSWRLERVYRRYKRAEMRAHHEVFNARVGTGPVAIPEILLES